MRQELLLEGLAWNLLILCTQQLDCFATLQSDIPYQQRKSLGFVPDHVLVDFHGDRWTRPIHLTRLAESRPLTKKNFVFRLGRIG